MVNIIFKKFEPFFLIKDEDQDEDEFQQWEVICLFNIYFEVLLMML
jgi:hypothetical protein